MLTLPIKKKWFDMILSGEKKEEYREIKDYWFVRFQDAIGSYDYLAFECTGVSLGFRVRFRNGYKPDSPSFDADVHLEMRTGRPEWGAEPNRLYYVLVIEGIRNGQE